MLELIFFGPLYVGFALIVAAVIAYFVVGLYNVFKYGLMALYDDWCTMRVAMKRRGAEMRALAEGRDPYEDDNESDTGTNGRAVRQPAVAEALGHVIRHPSMDGLVTGMDNNTVTRFNRK